MTRIGSRIEKQKSGVGGPMALRSHEPKNRLSAKVASGSLSELPAQTGGGFLSRMLPVRNQDRIMFLQQLGLTLRAGLSLTESLGICREQCAKACLSNAIGRMIKKIERGASLSQAMQDESRLFTPLVVRLIETAEASGEMDSSVEHIVKYLEQRNQTQSKLLTSLMYPVVIVLAAVGVTAFLVMKVLPKFAEFLARREAALPWTTQLLLDVASFLGNYGLLILGGMFAGFIAVVVTYLTPRGRLAIDRAMLTIPVIGSLVMIANMTLLCRTLSMLLRSGITLMQCLPISAAVLSNHAIARRVKGAPDDLLSGRSLSESLRDRVMPKMFLQIVAVGERTGNLSLVLDELGDHYAMVLQDRLQRLVSMIEPGLLITIGVVVGFVYQAFFHAVFQISTGGRG